MSITRRTTEGMHDFSTMIDDALGICDLQGLLMDSQWNPTTAVEAFEYSRDEDPGEIVGTAVESDVMYTRVCFAEALGVPFFMLLHREGGREIEFYRLAPDKAVQRLYVVQGFRLGPEGFLRWWAKRKRTVQTKPYRADLTRRINKSYYDDLLEANGMKWGGNIDGYLTAVDGLERKILGIVEKRFTNRTPIAAYDPARYFNYGGGDYNTWLPLWRVCEALNVPLFLFTFSRRWGEGACMGMTIVTGLSPSGITYLVDEDGRPVAPCRNLCRGVAEADHKIAALFSAYYGE